MQIEYSYRWSHGYVCEVPILDRGGGTDGCMREEWTDRDSQPSW